MPQPCQYAVTMAFMVTVQVMYTACVCDSNSHSLFSFLNYMSTLQYHNVRIISTRVGILILATPR